MTRADQRSKSCDKEESRAVLRKSTSYSRPRTMMSQPWLTRLQGRAGGPAAQQDSLELSHLVLSLYPASVVEAGYCGLSLT